MSGPAPASLPNLFIIGASNAGTTSLYKYLQAHPQVFMSPVKEPCFFSTGLGGTADPLGPEPPNLIRDWDAYRQLFAAVTTETAIGETSANYVYEPQTAARIHRHLPEARLIVSLRDPIDRAYSHFLMASRFGLETTSDFHDVVAAEVRGDPGNRPYLERGRYVPQLQRYLACFAREQLQVHLYDDVEKNVDGVVRSIFRFLEVDEAFRPDTATVHNRGGLLRRPRTHSFITHTPGRIRSASRVLVPAGLRRRAYWTLRAWSMEPAPPLDPQIRQQLLPVVRDDILALQDLIGRDLSAWLAS